MKLRGAENQHFSNEQRIIYTKDEEDCINKIRNHELLLDLSGCFTNHEKFATHRAYCTTLKNMAEARRLIDHKAVMEKWEKLYMAGEAIMGAKVLAYSGKLLLENCQKFDALVALYQVRYNVSYVGTLPICRKLSEYHFDQREFPAFWRIMVLSLGDDEAGQGEEELYLTAEPQLATIPDTTVEVLRALHDRVVGDGLQRIVAMPAAVVWNFVEAGMDVAAVAGAVSDDTNKYLTILKQITTGNHEDGKFLSEAMKDPNDKICIGIKNNTELREMYQKVGRATTFEHVAKPLIDDALKQLDTEDLDKFGQVDNVMKQIRASTRPVEAAPVYGACVKTSMVFADAALVEAKAIALQAEQEKWDASVTRSDMLEKLYTSQKKCCDVNNAIKKVTQTVKRAFSGEQSAKIDKASLDLTSEETNLQKQRDRMEVMIGIELLKERLNAAKAGNLLRSDDVDPLLKAFAKTTVKGWQCKLSNVDMTGSVVVLVHVEVRKYIQTDVTIHYDNDPLKAAQGADRLLDLMTYLRDFVPAVHHGKVVGWPSAGQFAALSGGVECGLKAATLKAKTDAGDSDVKVLNKLAQDLKRTAEKYEAFKGRPDEVLRFKAEQQELGDPMMSIKKFLESFKVDHVEKLRTNLTEVLDKSEEHLMVDDWSLPEIDEAEDEDAEMDDAFDDLDAVDDEKVKDLAVQALQTILGENADTAGKLTPLTKSLETTKKAYVDGLHAWSVDVDDALLKRVETMGVRVKVLQIELSVMEYVCGVQKRKKARRVFYSTSHMLRF